MRIRSIKPEFFVDEDLARLEPLDRLAFIGLWTAADKAGRLEDRPTRLSVQILPYDRGDFGARLDRLAAARFIIRYQDAGGRRLIQIRTWARHQVPHHTERPSPLPEPSERDLLSVTVTEPTENGGETVTLQEGMVRGMVRGKGKVMLKPRPRRHPGASVEEFARFWEAYPRRTAKGAAESAWGKLQDEDRRKILEILPRFAEAWAARPKEDLRYCPHPATWLNQRRWEDDPATAPPAQNAPRNGTPRPALVGAHPDSPTYRDLDDAPAWALETHRRLTAREPVSDEAADALLAWRAGENPPEPDLTPEEER